MNLVIGLLSVCFRPKADARNVNPRSLFNYQPPPQEKVSQAILPTTVAPFYELKHTEKSTYILFNLKFQ